MDQTALEADESLWHEADEQLTGPTRTLGSR